MTDAVRPTKKQRELLDYIESFIAQQGYSPSYREIMNGLHYNSVATVALHVGNLIKRGHLRKRDHSARSLEVVRNADRVSADSPQAVTADVHEQWLAEKAEQRMAEIAATSSLQELTQAGSVLVDAFKLLGLANHADNLQAKLKATHE